LTWWIIVLLKFEAQCERKPPTSRSIQMPYQSLLSEESFMLMYASTWWSLRRFNELKLALDTCDFSVIGSRRDTHAAIVAFMTQGIVGSTLFDENVRFPQGVAHAYYTDYDGAIANALSMLSSALSHRQTAVAKDTESNNPVGERVVMTRDVSEQDATKRFEELKKLVIALTRLPNLIWSRRSFEAKVSGSWAEPAINPNQPHT